MIDYRKNTENPKLSITIHNCEIQQVSEATYLGMKIDDKLLWTSHINKLCKALGAKIGFLQYYHLSV